MGHNFPNMGCNPCPSMEQRNLLAIQRNTEAIASLTVTAQELSAKDVLLQSQIDEWTATLEQKVVAGYRQLFEPDFEAERTARENADATLSERITAIESFDTTVPTVYATKADLLAVKESLQDEDIRLRTKIVNDDESIRVLLNEKTAALSADIATNKGMIGDNKAAIINEKAARETADLSIRNDVEATVNVVTGNLRSEFTEADAAIRNEFAEADAELEQSIATERARIDALEPVTERIDTLESWRESITGEMGGLYHITEEMWTETQTSISKNAFDIDALDGRTRESLLTLANRVTAIENLLINGK